MVVVVAGVLVATSYEGGPLRPCGRGLAEASLAIWQ
jgi:hypothetical protein